MRNIPSLSDASKCTTFYAQFHGEEGYAIRDAQDRVFWVDHDGQLLELTNADSPYLVFCGHVATAAAQHIADYLTSLEEAA